MAFTVVNYLPLTEEEASGGTHLLKKAQVFDNPDPQDDDETESNPDGKDLFGACAVPELSEPDGKEHFFVNSFKDYFYLPCNRPSPPPKI